ncbi:MAG: hypothetical protein SPI94_04660 [Candidatus Onthovivens sp.]|nr:hypothetical protein [Candidatus Onthovivens sp.]
MNEEEKEEIELDIEAKYVGKTEKEFLSRVTYAECIYILTPENKYCDKIKELSVLKICEIIKNLQKENKRLKTKIDICNCQEKSFREIIESKYIPKEKIKELIKRKKENIEGLHPASDCVLIDDFETQIDVLKQLLEENNYDE